MPGMGGGMQILPFFVDQKDRAGQQEKHDNRCHTFIHNEPPLTICVRFPNRRLTIKPPEPIAMESDPQRSLSLIQAHGDSA